MRKAAQVFPYSGHRVFHDMASLAIAGILSAVVRSPGEEVCPAPSRPWPPLLGHGVMHRAGEAAWMCGHLRREPRCKLLELCPRVLHTRRGARSAGTRPRRVGGRRSLTQQRRALWATCQQTLPRKSRVTTHSQSYTNEETLDKMSLVGLSGPQSPGFLSTDRGHAVGFLARVSKPGMEWGGLGAGGPNQARGEARAGTETRHPGVRSRLPTQGGEGISSNITGF